MDKYLIGKNVKILVSFATSSLKVGYSSTLYSGKVIDIDDHYVKINVTDSEIAIMSAFDFIKSNDCGVMLIRKEYIVLMQEL